MPPSRIVWTWTASSDAAELWRLVHEPPKPDVILVLADGIPADVVGDGLERWLGEPLAATVSPIPRPGAPDDHLERYELSSLLPPPPTLGAPNPRCVAIDGNVLRAVWRDEPSGRSSWPRTLESIAVLMVNRGWRHVGAPGLELGRAARGVPDVRDGGWGDTTVDEIEGPANEALSTHGLWARTRRDLGLVIDAACLDGGQHNGSQALVAHVAEALASTRPAASVTLAVESRHLDAVRAVTPEHLAVVRRGVDIEADVVYRPYQLLTPGELPWLARTGERLLIGQLDMIGFANPSYHPSPALFHTVRNLQRLTMRLADGVTFISEFGRRHALVECPDLEADRCFVVSSGASVPHAAPVPGRAERPFVLCLSAVFWHKHRDHAIRTFAAMVEDHGYHGDLCIAGPEPFYGRSSEAEAELMAALPGHVRDRVRFMGRVADDERWRLLAQADLVLYPSIVEGFGMVPFEAASAGTPTLVAPGSALGEVFATSGALVGSWDETEWASMAMDIVGSPARRDAIVARIAATAAAHTWDRVAVDTWSAIDAVLARPRARLHHEEGGRLSQVAGTSVATTSPVAHFANRLVAYGRRRISRTGH